MIAGLIYCSTVEACQETGDIDRARQWTAALTTWCDAQPDLVPFTGQCAVHRGQIMRLDGAFEDACEEFQLACLRYEQCQDPYAEGLALYEEGEVRLLLGQHELAAQAFAAAVDHGHDAQPGASLLCRDQGNPDRALAGLNRAQAETNDPIRRAQFCLPSSRSRWPPATSSGHRQRRTSLPRPPKTWQSRELSRAQRRRGGCWRWPPTSR